MTLFNALKLTCIGAACSSLMLISSLAQAVESDFPTSCQMTTEEREEDLEESRLRRAGKYLLSEMPSVIDDCAFGDRLKSAIDGLIGDLFAKIPTIDSLSGDFFCGFGADDAWRVGSVTADQEGRRDYATWWNETRSNARGEARGLSRQVPGQVQVADEREDDNWNRDNVFNKVWERVNSGGDEGDN